MLYTKHRLTREERAQQDQEALSRVCGNASMSNFSQVMLEFSARGIPLDEILPKQNVFTYKAWRALNRQVRKGEKGVKITTWFCAAGKISEDGTQTEGRKICTTAVVFHISQTDQAKE